MRLQKNCFERKNRQDLQNKLKKQINCKSRRDQQHEDTMIKENNLCPICDEPRKY